jgi:hypothetical protein
MTNEIQQIILRNTLTNEPFMRKTIPFIEPEYFDVFHKKLFVQIAKFVAKYNRLPTQESFLLEVTENRSLNDSEFEQTLSIADDLFTPKEENMDWLLDQTEAWCKDRAVYNALMESMLVYDGKHKTLTKNALPDILQKALGVSFDPNIGHDYFGDVESRYEFYHEDLSRIPFDLEMLNKITKNGFATKTLNVWMAGPGVGKSMMMCHQAAAAISEGRNVLYITMEMAEEKIAERIDANLLDISLDQIENLPKKMFIDRVNALSIKTQGQLIVKEYPTGQAHSNHFRALLNELFLKKSFKPDIVFIDYLNICTSARMKMGGSVNTYIFMKSVAEELRGLGVEFEVPVVTATQVNRIGYGSSDPGMDDTSESFGVPATADFMCALVTSDELEELGQIMVIQLKNRYRDLNKNKRFCLGIKKDKMRFHDVDNTIQPVVSATEDTGPVFDNSSTGRRISGEKFDSILV